MKATTIELSASECDERHKSRRIDLQLQELPDGINDKIICAYDHMNKSNTCKGELITFLKEHKKHNFLLFQAIQEPACS